MPGFAGKEIIVAVTDRRVTIHGQRVETERKGLQRRTTGVTGEFSDDLTPPTPVVDTAVTASLPGGVLTVHLPKEHFAPGPLGLSSIEAATGKALPRDGFNAPGFAATVSGLPEELVLGRVAARDFDRRGHLYRGRHHHHHGDSWQMDSRRD